MERLLRSLGADTARFENTALTTEISGVSTDSRSIGKDDVFFAIRGERFDGADFVEPAHKKGAILSVVNEDSRDKVSAQVPAVFVNDTVRALGSTARDFRSLFTGTVVGVTGTSGKTTVKEMILAVLGTRFHVHGTRGNYNNQIGVPLSVFGLRDCHECAVFEMGMSAPGEITYLSGITQPDIGVLLNVGPAHMEFFESLEAVADAKAELLESLDEHGTAVVNGDDPMIVPRLHRCRCRIVRFGIDGHAEFMADHIVVHPDGCATFEIESQTITLRVPGFHNVYNALAAFAVGRIMGVDAVPAARALESVSAPAMRMERIEHDGICIINDSYNANPYSMRAAAEVLEHTIIPQCGRKIAVLGDMLELGAVSEKAHREIGKLFGSLGLAYLCLVGMSADMYAEGAADSGMKPETIKKYAQVEDARVFVETIKQPGDVILVKGSRALGMERIVAGL